MNHATHNHALLGHLGVNLHLVPLLVEEVHNICYQRVHILKVHHFCVMVSFVAKNRVSSLCIVFRRFLCSTAIFHVVSLRWGSRNIEKQIPQFVCLQ